MIIKIRYKDKGKMQEAEVNAYKAFNLFGFRFYVHRVDIDPVDGNLWRVTELTTGFRICPDDFNTMREAVTASRLYLVIKGEENVNEVISKALEFIKKNQ